MSVLFPYLQCSYNEVKLTCGQPLAFSPVLLLKRKHALRFLHHQPKQSCRFAASGSPAHENSKTLKGVHPYVCIHIYARPPPHDPPVGGAWGGGG